MVSINLHFIKHVFLVTFRDDSYFCNGLLIDSGHHELHIYVATCMPPYKISAVIIHELLHALVYLMIKNPVCFNKVDALIDKCIRVPISPRGLDDR